MGVILDIDAAQRIIKREKDDTWKFFVEMGNIASNRMLERSYQGIENAWKNQPCYVIGAGPDLAEFVSKVGWQFLDDKHTIGINHVIEDYDGFEWFLFLDKRFLQLTTYQMANYKGRTFAHCSTGLTPEEKVTIFHTGCNGPTAHIQDGLFSSALSGLCALNLALISGANPIYLIGFGMGRKSTEDSYHYKHDYNGERKERKIFDKFQRVMKQFKRFEAYNNRIVHVTEGTEPVVLVNKMSFDTFAKDVTKPVLEWHGATPRIVHVSFTNDIEKHADITRYVIQEAFGQHRLVSQNERLPEADLYITEHFLSTDAFVKKFPHKEKAINIIHTVNCIPPAGFKRNIVLTNAWKKQMQGYFVNDLEVIYGGIDLSEYAAVEPAYDKQIFGRITRYSPGKIHPQWNEMVKAILEGLPEAQCLMYTQLDQMAHRPTLAHPRMHYDKSCQINMFKGAFLANLSVYVHCNGTFKETLSFAVIEAMATGLPIVYLDEKTGVLDEITGKRQLHCNTIEEVKERLIHLLQDEDARRMYGAYAREQAKKFDKKVMLANFNRVIKECVRK